MVQATRSCTRIIADGGRASGISEKTEIQLMASRRPRKKKAPPVSRRGFGFKNS
jgi:hypothetical protein